MDVVLGLLGILVWIVVVIVLAMAVTWLVVKVSPSRRSKNTQAEQPQG